MARTSGRPTTTWRNWSGLEQATPSRVMHPASADDVAAAVVAAREAGTTVRMTGTGHSFTPVARPEGTWLRPERLAGVLGVDHDRLEVTALAGTTLRDLNTVLEREGLSLHNMGDIAEQTLAGAVSTGTHGTGGVTAGLAAQVSGFTLVTGTGELLRATAHENPELLDLGRVALGALGVLVSLTFRVEPAFRLEALEGPVSWAELLGGYDDLVAAHHHVDAYWWPHTDLCSVKTNDRVADPADASPPLPRWRALVEDELLANSVYGALVAAAERVPSAIPWLNRLAGRAQGERRYADVAHRVLTSPRHVVFRETEWAVPRADGPEVLRECRRVIEAHDWRISFPVEIRNAPADDVPLSTAYGRDSFYLAFHTWRGADHTAYFAGVQEVLRAAGGRPHWGKLHSLTARDLSPLYPRMGDFLALRDRLDPDRVLANGYLRRVLG
jgi:FAD-linked oxidoreductase